MVETLLRAIYSSVGCISSVCLIMFLLLMKRFEKRLDHRSRNCHFVVRAYCNQSNKHCVFNRPCEKIKWNKTLLQSNATRVCPHTSMCVSAKPKWKDSWNRSIANKIVWTYVATNDFALALKYLFPHRRYDMIKIWHAMTKSWNEHHLKHMFATVLFQFSCYYCYHRLKWPFSIRSKCSKKTT